MKPEKLALLGKDNEHLSNIISDQVRFNPKLNPSDLYDEIIDFIDKKEKGWQIFTTNKFIEIKNPSSILKSKNFQYAIQFPYLILANKYFK